MVFGGHLNAWMWHIKKTLCHPKADEEKRSLFREQIDHFKQESRSLVFLDESGFAHDMPSTHGYALKGKRCFGKHDWGAKGRTNAIGALLNGLLLTVSLFDVTIDAIIFTEWIKQDLIPKLPPHSIVIMDSASFHKGKEMQEAIEKSGHTLLYLPTYSPDLNPIEQKWAQAKSIRRRQNCDIETLFHNNNW